MKILGRWGKGYGKENKSNIKSYVLDLIKFRKEYSNNRNISYSNINSMSENIVNLQSVFNVSMEQG